MNEEEYWEEPEPLTDEELAAFDIEAESREHYTEQLEYITRTHVTKEEGRKNKKAAASGNTARYGDARFSTAHFRFDELVDMHAAGMTFRRLPMDSVERWSTRFLVMDFDNSNKGGHEPANVTEQELYAMLDDCGIRDARITSSGDLKDYHWHLFIFLPEPVFSYEEFRKVRDDTEDRLRSSLMRLRGVTALPRLTDVKLYANTAVFGPRQPEVRPITKTDWSIDPDGRMQWGVPQEHLERSDKNPSLRTEASSVDVAFRDGKVPLSTSAFAAWLVHQGICQKERIRGLRYDFRIAGLLPYIHRGESKESLPIQTGNRHNTVTVFIPMLYAKARSYNLWLRENGYGEYAFTDENILQSFYAYIGNAYETGDGFELEEYANRLRSLMKRNAGVSDEDYCKGMEKYATGSGNARTRRYIRETANEIVERFTDADGNVRFDSARQRDMYLKDEMVSVYTIRKVARERGARVVTSGGRSGGNRKGAGRKPGVSWEGLMEKGELVDNVFHYVGKLSSTERGFLHSKGIKVKKKKKIVGNQK